MSDFLKKIRALTEARVATQKQSTPSLTPYPRSPSNFTQKLISKPGPRVIAEVKRASPSSGEIAMNLDPVSVAKEYQEAGAAAISVLTEPHFFGGSLETLARIRKALPESLLLMKDFVIDPYQLEQARAVGADAVLLMLSLLETSEFISLLHKTQELGLTPLVEVHNENEMKIALSQSVRLIGVNNRNLHTLTVSTQVSRQLATFKNDATTLISESGIDSSRLMNEFIDLGFDAFLIGSSLMKSQKPGSALRKLLKLPPAVKICGVTNIKDALLAVHLGAKMLGFVFTEKSPRQVGLTQAREIIQALPSEVRCFGVFTSEEKVVETVKTVGLQGVQFHDFEPTDELLLKLQNEKITTLQAFSVDENLTQKKIEDSPCDEILLDVCRTTDRVPLSYEKVQSLKIQRPFFIAGGLTAENIKTYLKALNPMGLDLASGVEKEPGIKCENKLRNFFKEIKEFYL